MTTIKAYPRHLQQCGYCLVPGGAIWFRQHGFDWRDFVKNGIDIELLRATGDAMAYRVIAKAEAENTK